MYFTMKAKGNKHKPTKPNCTFNNVNITNFNIHHYYEEKYVFFVHLGLLLFIYVLNI